MDRKRFAFRGEGRVGFQRRCFEYLRRFASAIANLSIRGEQLYAGGELSMARARFSIVVSLTGLLLGSSSCASTTTSPSSTAPAGTHTAAPVATYFVGTGERGGHSLKIPIASSPSTSKPPTKLPDLS